MTIIIGWSAAFVTPFAIRLTTFIAKRLIVSFFDFVEPLNDIPLAEAKPFDCSHTARRHPKETKGQDYNATTEASVCCDGGGCC